MLKKIKVAISRMKPEDRKDIQEMFSLSSFGKAYLLSIALKNTEVAEYILMY